jgi:hypothetical protein
MLNEAHPVDPVMLNAMWEWIETKWGMKLCELTQSWSPEVQDDLAGIWAQSRENQIARNLSNGSW